ncbi:FAD-binding protein [Amnibacterium kyonggiense]|uniref:Xylitol oxidase n=1 Tax=Amnibacterium kyonggiense TaxID=595671 RepID=A0A4R7FS74_9MICO|nr:FAD-binding protein [Amnibacterium kyonggiense]TDS80670.1 xylitol oxidase [Amnibacterium kyonggiense]
MRNWSGTVEYRATAVEAPTSIEEVQRLVERTPRIRALGTRHSFNDVADTDGVLVTTTEIPPDFALDEERRVVAVGAGTRYAAVATYLTEQGWALHNMGSLPHISVAGAISTGTHGSGDLNGNLSTAVRGLQLVGPDGALRWVRHGDADFPGSVVALGLLGVVVRVELAIEPSYLVRQDVYRGLRWATLLADVPAVTSAGYSVSVFTDWATDPIGQVWVKRRIAALDEAVPEELAGATRIEGPSQILESEDDNTTQQGFAGAWSAHLPHFRIDSTPSNGDEIQTEYFIDRSDAAPALEAVRALAADIAPLLLITELRTMAADDLWLSQASGRDSMAIHFTWRNAPDAVVALTPEIEAALDPFGPRPHWGKVHTIPAAVVASRYPRFADFRVLAHRIDPEGKFRGPATDRLLEASA